MFLIKSIYGKVWSDPNSKELAQISSGTLHLVRPGSVKGSRECIINSAMATIRRVSEYRYELACTRVYEEGEEQLLEEDDETTDEEVFPINESMQFAVGDFEGDPAFRWNDPKGDVGDVYEFVALGANAATSQFFETSMYKALYERKYGRSATNASENDLKEFVISSEEEPPQTPPSKKSRSSTRETETLAGAMGSLALTPKSAPAPKTPVASPSRIKLPEPGTPQATPGKQILSVHSQLYCWDADLGEYVDQGQCEARIVEIKPYHYYIIAYQQGSNVLAHEIESSLNALFKVPRPGEVFSFTWNHITPQGEQTSWCFCFGAEADYEQWRVAFAQGLYENLTGIGWAKVPETEREYILNVNDEDVIMNENDDDEDEEEVLDELAEESEEEEIRPRIRNKRPEWDSDEDDHPELPPGENDHLTVGYNKDRTFVARGNRIGVFKTAGEGELELQGSLSQIRDMKGKTFIPIKMMLHDQDSSMVLMDPSTQNSLFKMDIERGKVVEEWRVDDNVPILNMAPETKFAQMDPGRTLLGTSSNALFRIDPRLPGKKMVDSEFKQYAGKNKFSTLATTGSGKVAVASEKGDIRLFDKVGKNAKTALPAMGDAIIGVDVTKDGRWLVATCQTYLLVIDTKIDSGKYEGSSGFDRAFPADKKPIPKRLRLQNPHVQYMGGKVSFSPARFNTDPDSDEVAIITSSGKFIIAWDFKDVKKGRTDKYVIYRYDDIVKQDQFRFGDANDIIVALRNNVVMIKKDHLQNPSRPKSYGRGAGAGPSKSGIVNSPF
ncbi:VID27-domain-containing protein [Sistotremastrum suecicum HHB10207 ss-3]|uniref:VID27-domain-containing protein n=1 Tax=Sistotremastrum suecicum HHB10207 ss-3 TaxID=1314776 RepID=A0A166DAP3_9AGAM|nr:VID27-domain-containing protein [Sistotremastrum suecicum HHB10207 ss-3]